MIQERWKNFVSSVIFVSALLFSFKPGDLRAEESCEMHKIDASELKTISEIIRSCDPNNYFRKKTIGFGSYVCLRSYLKNKSAGKYLKLAENAKYVLVHNNAGGVAITGARIGDDMFDHKRTLIISGYCASACADYLFPAAERVIMIGSSPREASLAWHGSPDSNGLQTHVTLENHEKALEAHHEFLQRFTPAHREELSRLMDISRDGLSVVEERIQWKTWTYNDDELCNNFGIRNITRIPTNDFLAAQ